MEKGKLWPSADPKPLNRSSPNLNHVIMTRTPTTKNWAQSVQGFLLPIYAKFIHTLNVRMFTSLFRPPGTVAYGRLIFCVFLSLWGAISPKCLGRSPWSFHTWLEVRALRQCTSQFWGPLPKTILKANGLGAKSPSFSADRLETLPNDVNYPYTIYFFYASNVLH